MRSRASRGFSLIETMVSLAILSFGMVGIMQLQIISVRTNAQSRKMAQATALAKDLGLGQQRRKSSAKATEPAEEVVSEAPVEPRRKSAASGEGRKTGGRRKAA